MPIVETPQEGLNFFLECDLDILVLNNRVIRKRSGVGVSRNFSVAKLFNEDLNVLLRRNADQARTVGGIYQFNINAVQTWTLDLSGIDPIIMEGTISSPPNTIIEASDQALRDILLDPNHGAVKRLQSGDIKITGEFEHAVNLLGLFKVISASGNSLINSAAIQETADGDQTAEINSRMAQ
jgi:hypothetical protein